VARLAADAPRALKAIRAARAAARQRAWDLAGDAAPGTGGGLVTIDIDATIVTSCSEKEQAMPTWKKTYGHHPFSLITARTAPVSRWRSCCGPGTPAPIPRPITSRPPGWDWRSCPVTCAAGC